MRMRLILTIFYMLVISVVMATEYQFDAGSYTVRFNSSQELVILSPLPHEESSSHAIGWDISIQDNMTHSIAFLGIVEEDQIMPLSNELMAGLLDNNMKGLSGLKSKKTIKLNGVDGLMTEGYSPQLVMDYKLAIAPFDPFYDSFFNRIATKCFIILGGYDLPVYNEIIDSLNITTNQWSNTAASGEDLNAETLNNKGLFLYNQGKYDEAVKAFDKAIEINSQYEAAWVGKGTTLGSQGKYDEAIKAFDKAIEINPQYADAWAGKGFALQLLGQTDKADATFAKVKELGFSYAGGVSWLLLKPLGAIVQVNATPEKILEVQFNATSVEEHGDSYILTVPGRLKATLPDDLGYPGTKAVKMDNGTKVTIIAASEMVITNYLKKNLDADVKVVQVAPVLYEIRTNVTRESLDVLLAPIGGKVPAGEDAFIVGVTPETLYETKTVLDSKLNRLGLQGTNTRVVDNKYVLISIPEMDLATAQQVVSKPGKFEIRIQTDDNQTIHVLYGDAIESVDKPQGDREGEWGVPFTLSEEGAAIFQKAAIDAGAAKNPDAHPISMYLDKDEFFSAPLSAELAGSMANVPVRALEARVGTGDAALQKAKELYVHLIEGPLPVNSEVIWGGMRWIA